MKYKKIIRIRWDAMYRPYIKISCRYLLVILKDNYFPPVFSVRHGELHAWHGD